MIPYGRQSITEDDIHAVVDVLRSDWLTQGPTIDAFERVVANYCGAKYAVAVSNATAALHIACLAAGLGPDDTLWTSPNSFLASANCGRYCGSNIDFVDIAPDTYNLSVGELEKKLHEAALAGRLPKVIVPVHFAGQSCAMREIAELANRYEIKLIEDASHAIGGSYLGTKIGACEFSDMTVFSFHPVKIVTTGEGGMVLTNDDHLYQQLTLLRSHGMTRDPALLTQASPGPWYYEQIELGFNYRMTDIQAALGISQMRRIDEHVMRRHELVSNYNAAFGDYPVRLPWQAPDTYSAFHLYVICLQLDQCRKSHREVFEALRHEGIGVNLHYIPIHTQPYYQALGFAWGDFPIAEQYYREAISLPLYPGLNEQSQVIAAVQKVLS